MNRMTAGRNILRESSLGAQQRGRPACPPENGHRTGNRTDCGSVRSFGRMFPVFLTAAVLFFGGSGVSLGAGGDSYYRKHEEGWFWYQDPPPQDYREESGPEADIPVPASPDSGESAPGTAVPVPEYSGDGLLTAAYLKKALPVYLERALDNPTPENVRDYFALQKMSMDKSQNFAGAARILPLLYPDLDEARGRTDYGRGREIQERMAEQERETDLRKLAGMAGIFFLYRSSCPYCREALKEMDRLAGYGFRIMGISLDEGLLPVPGAFRNVSDPAMGGVLGIVSVPAIVLAAPDTERKFVTVSTSLLRPRETEDRILEGGRILGLMPRNAGQ